MKTIWKFTLEIRDRQRVYMPSGAKPLSVGVQRGEVVLWAEVEPDNKAVLVSVVIFGTGNPVDASGLRFVGTFQIGEFVGHVYVQDKSS